MPSLDIFVGQSACQNLCRLQAQGPLHGTVISSPFTFGIDNKLPSSWTSSGLPTTLCFNSGNVKITKNRLLIKAVATFERKGLVNKMGYNSSNLNKDSSPCISQPESSSDGDSTISTDTDDKEKLRRMSISKVMKGKSPWNKGRKHSPETLQLIKERTRLAMQNPKVKMKLVNLALGHVHSEETRKKIGIAIRMSRERQRQKQLLQENCCFDWKNLIAEASRRGCDGEVELQWDSHKILDEKLREEYLESIEQRKRRQKGTKRPPISLEQRKKISQAISAKWNDPGYRERVVSGMGKYHNASFGPERKTRKRPPSNGTRSQKKSPTKKFSFEDTKFSRKKIKLQKMRLRRSNKPMYKDPPMSSKIEMIKNIRVQRAATENKQSEAIERAKLMIAEAEKAAMALEAYATTSPIARASLIETRQLIAEAIRATESIDKTVQVSSHENEEPLHRSNKVCGQSETEDWFRGKTKADDVKVNGTSTYSFRESDDPFFTSNDVLIRRKKEPYTRFSDLTGANNGKMNGTKTLSSVTDENLSFDKHTLQLLLNDGEDLPQISSDVNGLPPVSIEQSDVETPSSASVIPSSSARVTKKWVRGRLIEVPEEAQC